eukprot:Tbor_TRINITY_DN3644_c0_g1::TRINITY_DN3644_c0_g1_i2::g.273::m.273
MVFSIPNYITIGDQYKTGVIDERLKGKSFLVPVPKKGKMPDALFSKEYLSIHEGDKYVDTAVADRRYRNEKSKKNICPQGFRYANFPQKSTGAGSYFGTFDGKPIPHQPEFLVPLKGDPISRLVIQPRQMLTNPGKKGTFGYVGTTISNIGHEYIADFFDQRKMNEKAERDLHRIKMKGAAFRNAGRRGYTFDEALGTGVSSCYTLTKPIPVRKGYTINKYSIIHKKLDHQWVPACRVPSDIKVEYREDPYGGIDPRGIPRKKKEDVSQAPARRAWKPSSSTDDSWYTSTIAFRKL